MSSENVFSPLRLTHLRDPDLERHEAEARAQGYAVGYAAGKRAADRDLLRRRAELEAGFAAAERAAASASARAADLLTGAAVALHKRTQPVINEVQQAIAAAAVDLAEAVIGSELQSSEHSARSALNRVLSHADSGVIALVRMHPTDLAVIRGEIAELPAIEFIADETLAPGDAIAELPEGYLDARISAALERATSVLIGDER